MTPNILDLRQERCPMALLLAKRHSVKLEVGQSLSIYVSDNNSSMKDIVTFCSRSFHDVITGGLLYYHHLLVNEKELQSDA